MIKTIDITNITDEMIEVAAASAQLRAMQGVTEHTALIRGSILAALIAAPTVGPTHRCNCCGYLVTDSEHKGCLRAAQQEQAQAVPVKDSYLDQCLEQRMAAMESAAPLDSDTKRMVLELCNAVYEHIAVWKYPYGKLTLELAKQIREKLEAGNEH